MDPAVPLGAVSLPGERATFQLWAPKPARVDLLLLTPRERIVPLERDPRGHWFASIEGVAPGTLYQLLLDGKARRPDPVSRAQPKGVHGPSELVDLAYPWKDAGWRGVRLQDLAIYELHVGTFTPEGTFDAAITRLPALRDLGVTAIEVMPVASFPGDRNWGYDGVGLFAAQASYGGPRGLQRLVCAAHAHGLGVVLDVVYNHLGPEGNYLGELGPYFNEGTRTPWGAALNFDAAGSDHVRRFFLENALQWIADFHVDALRLDAVHAIHDASALPFLTELRQAVDTKADALGRRVHLIAESDSNDPRLVREVEAGGVGMHAQWSDDFHHSLHALLTGERATYYADFGRVGDLAKSIREGFVRDGQPSIGFGRRHGRPSHEIPGERLVVCAQNHDQVGNRAHGDRLSTLIPFEAQKVAAGILLLAPFVPLLFMGEEYGETAPFLFFTSHGDPGLIEAVRAGRAREYSHEGAVPDPQDPETFRRSKLDWSKRATGEHAALLALHHELLRLRREAPFAGLDKHSTEVSWSEAERLLVFRRAPRGQPPAVVIARLGTPASVPVSNPGSVPVSIPLIGESLEKVFDSSEPRWGGPGSRAPDRLGGSEDEVRLLLPGLALVVYRANARRSTP